MLKLFGRGKKAEKEKEIKAEIKKGEKLLDKHKKKDKNKGPAWLSVVILMVTVLLGLIFWSYGKLSEKGWTGTNAEEDQGSGGLSTNSDGVIVIEK